MPPLDDVRVRQAINAAINRDEVVAAHNAGLGEPAWMPLPSAHWAFAEDLVPTYPYDPDRARELLAEAGYPDGVTITATVQATAKEQRLGEIVQAQLAEVGIDLELTAMDALEGVDQFFVQGNYHAAVFPWSGRPDPSLTYYALFAQDVQSNAGHVPLEGFDELIAASRATTDLTERAAIFREIDLLLIDQAPYAPLAYKINVVGYNNRVGGYVPGITGKPVVTDLFIDE